MHKIAYKQILRINALFWTGWLFLYAFVIWHLSPAMPGYDLALIEAFGVIFPLFLLSLILWPICRRLEWRRFPTWFSLSLHLFLAGIFAALWLVLSYGCKYLVSSAFVFDVIDVRQTSGWQIPQGLLTYMMVAGVYYALIYYQELSQREARELQLKSSLQETEWKALQAQINPRFLVNALNSIIPLITSKPGSARQMLIQLLEMLRRVLNENPTQTVTLEKELAFVRQYLDLEKIRLGGRLYYEENVDPALFSYQIPVMTLQPLLENAIQYGISSSIKGGWIRLRISKQDGNIAGTVENSLDTSVTPPKGGEGESAEGLRTLKRRLALLYGKDFQFSAQAAPAEKIFRVRFAFPVDGSRTGTEFQKNV